MTFRWNKTRECTTNLYPKSWEKKLAENNLQNGQRWTKYAHRKVPQNWEE